jgi:tape measure domain-containing protein
MSQALQRLATTANAQLDSVSHAMHNIGATMSSSTAPAITAAAAQFRELESRTNQVMSGVREAVQRNMADAASGTQTSAHAMSNAVHEYSTTAVTQLDSVARAARSSAESMRSSTDPAVRSMAQQFSQLEQTVRQVSSAIRTDVHSAVTNASQSTTTAGNSMRATMSHIATSVNHAVTSVRGFAGHFSAVTSAAHHMKEAVTSAFSKISGILTGSLTSGFRSIIGYARQFATLGLETYASWENSQLALQALQGSMEKGNETFQQLQKFAELTPFEFSDILGPSQRFLVFAERVGMAKDQLVPFITVLGNMAFVTMSGAFGMERAALAMQQMASRGKVTLEDMNQLNDAFPGFSGVLAIAQGMGLKEADVLDKITKGEIDTAEGLKYVMSGMRTFPGVAGAMEKASKTLGGQWSTFQDQLKKVLVQAVTPLVPKLEELLAFVSEKLPLALEHGGKFITDWITRFKHLRQEFETTPLEDKLKKLASVFMTDAPKRWSDALHSVFKVVTDHKEEITNWILIFAKHIESLAANQLPKLIEVLAAIANAAIHTFRVIAEVSLWLNNFILDVAISILRGMEFAFGWIPGMRDKYEKAIAATQNFRDRINTSISEILAAKEVTVSFNEEVAVAQVNRIKSAVRSIQDKTVGVHFNVDWGALAGASPYATMRQLGGYISEGQLAWVGEAGPELIRIQNGIGQVMSHTESVREVQRNSSENPVYSPNITVPVTVLLDSKEISAQIILDPVRIAAATDEGRRKRNFIYSQRMKV